MKKSLNVVAAAAAMFAAGCVSPGIEDVSDREALYQVSTLQGLVAGDFYGSCTLEDLLVHGDIGLGTFEGVDGELVLLDGELYQVQGNGNVARPGLETKTPFAAVTFLDEDRRLGYSNPITFEQLKENLCAAVKLMGDNSFYACRIDGEFASVKARSEFKQSEPYKTLPEALKNDQRDFLFENVKGTLVGIYCPAYAGGINAPGWHLHFLTEDRKQGGHVFDFVMNNGSAILDKTDKFAMRLPGTEYFGRLCLTGLEEEVKKSEQQQ